MDTTYIYGLSDPRTPDDIRYVGQSKNLVSRCNAHSKTFTSVAKSKWINELREIGLKPSVRVLEVVETQRANERESAWIHQLDNPNLLNVQEPFFGAPPLSVKTNLPLTLAEVEKRYIISMVKRNSGNKLEAAKALGIGRQTLYNKLEAYGTHIAH